VGDVAALASRLHEIAVTPGLGRSLGEAGARDVENRFASETMADAIDALYERLLHIR